MPNRLRLVLLAAALVAAALPALTLPSPAHAEWRKATTDRFVIYSEGSEADLRERTERLHRFDRLVRAPFGLSDAPPARALTIFLTSGRSGMEAIWPGVPRNAGGYYSSTEHDIYASLPRQGDESIILHEYVHHVMRQNFPGATPAWFTEGVADYYRTARIDDRETRVGYRDDGRVATMNRLPWMPIETLMTRRALSANREHMAAFYAQSWLLTHYLLSDPARLKQLEAYLQAVGGGASSLEAIQPAFGMPPEELERAIRRYRAGTMQYAVYPTPPAPPVAIRIETLPPSADALFPLYIRLNYPQRGSDGPALLARVRETAARWPDDRLARMTLAKAEYQLGDRAAAETSLTAVLTADPADPEALRWMARLRMDAANAAADAHDVEGRDRLLRQARAFLGRAMNADPDDYRIYLALGRSRRTAAGYPDDNDLATWAMAAQLAPQVAAVRWEAAEAFSRAGRNAEAADLLLPLANDPHGGPGAARARQRLQQLRPDSEASTGAEAGSEVADEADQG